MTYLFIFIGILAGFLLGGAAAYLYMSRLKTRIAVLEQGAHYASEQLAQQRDAAEAERRQHEQQLQRLDAQYREAAEEARRRHEQQLQQAGTQYRESADAMRRQHEAELQKAELQYRDAIGQMRKQHEEQMGQQMQLIREQMNTASERILKERAEQLSSVNREQLSHILTPLQANIQQMREAVEKSDRQHTATMQRLDASIKTTFELSREVGERADKLAQALTGENKTQGNFGELRLKQLLEGMGLEEGEQFELQETMKDADGRTIYDEGHRMVPDAILHFPDQRDVIIDSKMSFTAFEDYHNAETDTQRQDALRRHIASMRAHVSELSRKNYSRYVREGRGRLDFVLMYVFSESALQLALSNDPTLWKEAYDKGVVIAGSQNLYMMLRVLEMTWRQVRQVENQAQIIQLANLMVDRVQVFAERMGDVRRQFDRANEALLKVESSTADGGPSIITTARQLLKMGATENSKRKKTLREAPVRDLPDADAAD